jgi:hypothetical protein
MLRDWDASGADVNRHEPRHVPREQNLLPRQVKWGKMDSKGNSPHERNSTERLSDPDQTGDLCATEVGAAEAIPVLRHAELVIYFQQCLMSHQESVSQAVTRWLPCATNSQDRLAWTPDAAQWDEN